MIATGKIGVVQFKSQKDIIEDRKKKTDREFEELQKRVNKLMKSSYQIAHNALSER